MTKKPMAKTINKPLVQGGKPQGNSPAKPVVALKAGAEAPKAPAEPKKPFNPVKFFTEVRLEARRITWPSRKETWITTVMVLLMVVIATIFFALVDLGFGTLTSLVLKGQV
jgi:preprotein translocase subunit SecE